MPQLVAQEDIAQQQILVHVRMDLQVIAVREFVHTVHQTIKQYIAISLQEHY